MDIILMDINVNIVFKIVKYVLIKISAYNVKMDIIMMNNNIVSHVNPLDK